MEQPPQAQIADEGLVTKTLENPNEFGALIERYETKLRRYIARLGVRDHDDQADVLQEIFIKAYRNLHSFNHTYTFSAWLYRIAHNEAISWYRKQSVRPEGHLIADGDEVLELLSSKEATPELAFDLTINAREVAEALKKVDTRYREVLLLRYFEHKEYDEISDILKIPVGSVGTFIHRGKKQLHAVLNHHAVRI